MLVSLTIYNAVGRTNGRYGNNGNGHANWISGFFPFVFKKHAVGAGERTVNTAARFAQQAKPAGSNRLSSANTDTFIERAAGNPFGDFSRRGTDETRQAEAFSVADIIWHPVRECRP